MSTQVELAVQAVVAALAARAANPDGALPPPTRGEVVKVAGDGGGRFLNVIEGNPVPLGKEAGTGPAQEFNQAILIEWVVEQAAAGPRDAEFDAGMAAIAEALGMPPGGDRTLGGAVDNLRLTRVTRIGLATDGYPSVKAAEIEIQIPITADSLIG